MPKTLERPTEAPEAPVSTTKDVAEPKIRPLTGHDRCDAPCVNRHNGVKGKGSCGAQAFVLAVMPNSQELTFCGHHAGMQKTSNPKNATLIEGLKAAGALIHSDYDTINGKPSM